MKQLRILLDIGEQLLVVFKKVRGCFGLDMILSVWTCLLQHKHHTGVFQHIKVQRRDNTR